MNKKKQSQERTKLKFDYDTAGGVMQTNILTFYKDYTIKECIDILKKINHSSLLRRVIYILNQEGKLVGHINLEDLILKEPDTKLKDVLRKNVLVINSSEDREEVASKMKQYNLSIVPVVLNDNYFLGIINHDTLLEIIKDEAAEDLYRISGVHPIRLTYFKTSFIKLFSQRSSILIVLLLIQTFSVLIINHYQFLLAGFLISFISLIASTGGNTSNQTSALVIEGLVSGEIREDNVFHFLKREFLMAIAIGITLGFISFIRIYITNPENFQANFAVSISLGIIVIVSVLLGSLIPIILKKFNLDPAFSAGPFLATLMDILGILIYCYISKTILGY